MPTAAIATFGAGRLDPIKGPDDASVEVVNLVPSTTFLSGQLVGELIGTRAVQTITITGTPTGGTFTLTFAGQTTAAIPYNATAAQVEEALEALSTIGEGGVVAAGTALPGGSIAVTWQTAGVKAALTHTDSLTGGSSPAVVITATTAGTAGTPGTYGPYDEGNTDGSQIPTGILQYACVTDASGNVTLGGPTAGAAEWAQTQKGSPMYTSGEFSCADLVGLDNNAVAKLGRLTQGDVLSGRFLLYGA